MKSDFVSRVIYRCWQAKQVLFPKIDASLWKEARNTLPESWRPHLDRLRPSERAHVLRVYDAIKNCNQLSDNERTELILLALVHDLGKGITRHSIVFKALKVIFPISNAAHCIEGAKLLKRLGADKKLIRMVLRHHNENTTNDLLKKFQSYDDRL